MEDTHNFYIEKEEEVEDYLSDHFDHEVQDLPLLSLYPCKLQKYKMKLFNF